MNDNLPVREDEPCGGDSPCWAHLLDEDGSMPELGGGAERLSDKDVQPVSTHRLPARHLGNDEVRGQGSSHGPERTVLAGQAVRLEPLDPKRHAAQLYAASHGTEAALQIWTYLPYGPFPDLESFTAWLRERAASEDPLFFAVRDSVTVTAGGMVSFLAIEPQHRSIEIGHIWFGPALQNTRQSTEALYLLMAYTFRDLAYRRLEWKCDAANADSRAAAERLGFEFEGFFHQHRIVKGRNRDTAWFSLLDYEWPLIETNFRRWLSPDNFDERGLPRHSLRALNAAVRPSGKSV